MSEISSIIIQGKTRDGALFRPSDWVERMCSSYATFGDDRKLKYSPHLKPVVIDGLRCLWVDITLKSSNPNAYVQLMQFVNENQLMMLDNNGNSFVSI